MPETTYMPEVAAIELGLELVPPPVQVSLQDFNGPATYSLDDFGGVPGTTKPVTNAVVVPVGAKVRTGKGTVKAKGRVWAVYHCLSYDTPKTPDQIVKELQAVAAETGATWNLGGSGVWTDLLYLEKKGGCIGNAVTGYVRLAGTPDYFPR